MLEIQKVRASFKRKTAFTFAHDALWLAPFGTSTFAGLGGQKLLITATPARHGPIGIEPMSGDVTGDTVWHEGTAEVAQLLSPEVVLLFAGAPSPGDGST
jgi:hypothetical protein